LRNYPNSDGTPDGLPVMPTLWLQTSAYDTTPTYTFPKSEDPQAVVVNLGTNDFAYLSSNVDANGNPIPARDPMTESVFAAGMAKFVSQIRSQYPFAKIFLVSSPMLNDGWPVGQNQHSTQLAGLEDAQSQLGDKNVFVVDLPPQGSDVGCDYHPTPATHQQMADVLLPVMKKALRW